MKSTLLIAGALIEAAATLLSVPASANIDASQSWTSNATINAPETAKPSSWQTAETGHTNVSHSEGDSCGLRCGQAECEDPKNKLWLCKVSNPDKKPSDAWICNWKSNGVCTNNLKPGEDINRNAEKEKKAAEDRRKANEQRAADEKKAEVKKAADEKKKADEKKAADDKKKADEKKTKDNKK
jgi:hypothetical protein